MLGKLRLNSKPLAKRLAELFAAHPVESTKLFVDPSEFAVKAARTRNAIVHHQVRVDETKVFPDSKLSECSYRLELFIWVLLLKEIGLGAGAVDQIVGRIDRARFYRLSS